MLLKSLKLPRSSSSSWLESCMRRDRQRWRNSRQRASPSQLLSRDRPIPSSWKARQMRLEPKRREPWTLWISSFRDRKDRDSASSPSGPHLALASWASVRRSIPSNGLGKRYKTSSLDWQSSGHNSRTMSNPPELRMTTFRHVIVLSFGSINRCVALSQDELSICTDRGTHGLRIPGAPRSVRRTSDQSRDD